ncbi:hypothetical protein LXA43DRAFT_703486 [Ganoderma leucocontextum]|nr:hypothetical protein LXA43DRAFT_703486 [Ganoderma leucocontextum]
MSLENRYFIKHRKIRWLFSVIFVLATYVLVPHQPCWNLVYLSWPYSSTGVLLPFAQNASSDLGILRSETRQTWSAWTVLHFTCHTRLLRTHIHMHPTRPSHEGQPPLIVPVTYGPHRPRITPPRPAGLRLSQAHLPGRRSPSDAAKPTLPQGLLPPPEAYLLPSQTLSNANARGTPNPGAMSPARTLPGPSTQPIGPIHPRTPEDATPRALLLDGRAPNACRISRPPVR